MGTTDEIDGHAVIFFDGVCNLCNSSVNFILDRDPQGYFRFAPLQSDIADEILSKYSLKNNQLESIVLIEKGKVYDRSDAVLSIAKKLPGFWKLFYYLGLIIPKTIRDWMYDKLAGNRYGWFGKREQCRMPTPDIKERFLESS